MAGKDFDEAGGLVLVGIPAVIIGIILVIKGYHRPNPLRLP